MVSVAYAKTVKTPEGLSVTTSVRDFELVVNSFNTTDNVSIFLTGSNSKLLSGELATRLGGRTVSFHVMPFNFREQNSRKLNGIT